MSSVPEAIENEINPWEIEFYSLQRYNEVLNKESLKTRTVRNDPQSEVMGEN